MLHSATIHSVCLCGTVVWYGVRVQNKSRAAPKGISQGTDDSLWFSAGSCDFLPVSAVCLRQISAEFHMLDLQKVRKLGDDFREGDEDSNFSIFGVRRFSEWPEPLH